LDSLICRNSRVFENVRFLVLDELHLIDKTYRGDHLRILLRRFRQLVQGDLCCYALSATLSNPKEIAERYLGDSVILSVPGTRELEYKLFGSLDRALATARERRMHKVLIFCNRRKEVEEVARKCKDFWPEERIVVHHGKLAKKVRDESETFMRQCQWGLCVATMTLEIGVDIGDIDAVMLYGAPWSVSSLIQRVGRGNRRRHTSVAFGIYRNPEEKLIFRDMFERAKEGDVEDWPYEPDPSVVVQQIFSYLYQNPGGLEEDLLFSLFEEFISTETVTAILSHLERLGYIEKRTGRWFASTKIMNMGERGIIHSNISDPRDYLVIDATTGAKLGEVSAVLVENVFRIAGKAWKLVGIDGASLYVVPAKGDAVAEFSKSPAKGAFSWLLPPGI
jgi:ATP-dependent Lhr-like helicase